MHVRMPLQRLAPRVQHHLAADPRSQMTRIGRHFEQRFADRLEQQVVKTLGVSRRERVQFFGNREHHVIVFDRQQFGLPSGEPGRPLTALAERAMPVAARVVQRRGRSAGRAAVQPPAHRGRAAAGQASQRLALLRRDVRAVPLEVSGTVPADDRA